MELQVYNFILDQTWLLVTIWGVNQPMEYLFFSLALSLTLPCK